MSEVERFIRFCESEFGTDVMDREASYVKAQIGTEDLVLDVGCGIGSLEERAPDYELIGLDRSAAMVKTARQRVSAPFVRGDATALPIATASVDAVVFVATLEFIPAIDAVLTEATRVLAPSGKFIALVLNTRSNYVQSNVQREGSYFQRMVHGDSEALLETVMEYVDGEQEFFLGISGDEVYESSDPETAAISAVVGTTR